VNLNLNEIHIIEILIIIDIIILLQIYIFYPLLILVLAKLFPKSLKINENYEPLVTIIIAAYNEENLIEDAIHSITKSDYPIDKIKIIVGSDGSTDKTVEKLIILSKIYKNLEFYEFPRIGKNKVLNELMKNVNTELVFYMDADVRLNRKSLKNLISKFSDNSIGAVISSMKIKENSGNTGKQGETRYQNYEKLLRISESNLSSTVNSLGAFYGIRKSTYKPIPNELVCDDLFPLYNSLLQRKRVIFTDDEPVKEIRSKSLTDEFSRRIRLTAGGLATVKECWQLLSPRYGWVSFFLWHHKLLRWFTPFFLIILLILTLYLDKESWLFMPVVIFQMILYVGALFGWISDKIGLKNLLFKILLFIVSMNFGFLIGIIRFLSKKQNTMWERIDT